MNPVHVNRLFKMDIYRKVFQLPLLRFCSTEKTKCEGSGLDAVAACVSGYMRERGTIKTDLLVIDNPADVKVMQKFQEAGVRKIACTIKHEKHFLNIQDQLAGSLPVYMYNLLTMHKKGTNKLSAAVETEDEILSLAGKISGVVILASGVSDFKHLESHLYLVKRLLTMESLDGFQSLRKLDWFLALPGNTQKVLSQNYNSIRCLNSFYDHRNCVTEIKYSDVAAIFHTVMDKKVWKKETPNFIKKVSRIQESNVSLVHFTPKFDVLEQTSLEDRVAYKKFINLISGRQRLIPALEKVFPGCGLGLIELGYGMADEIYQIPYDQFLQVYKDVQSLPEYEGSALQHLCSGIEVTDKQDGNLNIFEPHMWRRRKSERR